MAEALNMPVRVVQASLNLLIGIHDAGSGITEGQEHQPESPPVSEKVTGPQQIEITETMFAANDYFAGYAEALVLGTAINSCP